MIPFIQSLGIGTLPQWLMLASIMAGIIIVYIRTGPARGRVKIEADTLAAKIEEDLRGEAAVRFREFRDEVHGLRHELQLAQNELRKSVTQSVRRGDKLNMVLFILRMVMDELHAKDPKNKTLAQARTLLERVEDEPHQAGGSAALNKAEDTVDEANATVREIKAQEAKK